MGDTLKSPVFRCPSTRQTHFQASELSYGMDNRICYPANYPGVVIKLSCVRFPSEKMLLGECYKTYYIAAAYSLAYRHPGVPNENDNVFTKSVCVALKGNNSLKSNAGFVAGNVNLKRIGYFAHSIDNESSCLPFNKENRSDPEHVPASLSN